MEITFNTKNTTNTELTATSTEFSTRNESPSGTPPFVPPVA